MFERYFFGNHQDSIASYHAWMHTLSEELVQSLPGRPCSGEPPVALADFLRTDLCPSTGRSLDELRQQLGVVIGNSVALWHPHTAAHLHTPVLLPALAAELVITALNQSMDSFDQAPAATVIEQAILEWLCREAGLPATAGGTFTAGGTQSNYMALLLARDHFLATHGHWPTRLRGLPPDANRLRVLCSDIAHFSVEKATIQLGLGTQSVVKVACDSHFRLCLDDLVRQIRRLRQDGFLPIAVVATAGTTDFGSFDPLAAIASVTSAEGLWLHVDAAYGGALLLSPRYRERLDGLSRADSVTIDFHKAFFQPISCGAFLLADQRRFDLIRVHADYLNSESREKDGIPDLVTRSVLTTRRFDALKLWVSLQALGRDTFAAMIERLVTLAQVAAQIRQLCVLRLLHEPQFGCVVFRYCPQYVESDADTINEAISRVLFDRGVAVLGHTKVRGQVYLKLTLNNPCTTPAQIASLLEMIIACGRSVEMKGADALAKAKDLGRRVVLAEQDGGPHGSLAEY